MLFNSMPVHAQGSQSQTRSDEQKIDISADKLSSSDGSAQVEATGSVVIKRQQTTLKAEEVRVNRETLDIEAKGKVSLDDPEWKIKSADSMHFNMDQETGDIQRGDIFIEQGHISISGRRLQKLGGQAYHVDESFFTTCLCESGAPSWKFSADAMDLSLDGLGTIRNGYFYIFDIPIFYLPYGFFPIRTERQTGFLFPNLGHSTKDGFRFQQPFFWAISKSSDASLALDVETRARVGVWGELRKRFDKDSDFELQSAYFNENLRKDPQKAVVDRTIADQNIPGNRWGIIGTHRYATDAGWLTYSDTAAYRDDLFTRELIGRFELPGTDEFTIQTSRYGKSQFGAFKNWDDMFFKGGWNFYQDFIQSDGITPQRTPQLTFWGRRFLADFPLEFLWRGEGVNYWSRKNGNALRLDLRPELRLPLRAGPAVFGSFSVAPRETVYHLYRSPVKSSDQNVSRELVEVRGNIGTAFSQVFNISVLDLARLKHVIEPELSYLFIPKRNQSQIPIIDDVDRVERRNVLTLSLTNRFWGKTQSNLGAAVAENDPQLLNPLAFGDVRDLGYFKLALSYDIDKERHGGDTLSDLDFKLRILPTNYISLGFSGGVNPGPWTFSQVRANVNIVDPRPLARRVADPDFNQPNSIGFIYSFLRKGPLSYLAEDANAVVDCALQPLDPQCPSGNTAGNFAARIFYHVTDNILLSTNTLFNVLDGSVIGVRASTKFLSFCECWSMTLGVKHNINPSKTSVNFDFNLLGLGSQKSTIK